MNDNRKRKTTIQSQADAFSQKADANEKGNKMDEFNRSEQMMIRVDKGVADDEIQFPIICCETAEFDFESILAYVRTAYDHSDKAEKVNETVYRQLWPVTVRAQQCKRSTTVLAHVFQTLMLSLYQQPGDYWLVSFAWADDTTGRPPVSIFNERCTAFANQCFGCRGAALEQIPKTYASNWMVSCFIQLQRALIDPRDVELKRLTVIPELLYHGRNEFVFRVDDWNGRCRTAEESKRTQPYIQDGHDNFKCDSRFPLADYLEMKYTYYDALADNPFPTCTSPVRTFNCCRRCYYDAVQPAIDNFE